MPRVNNPVNAMTVWDPDGEGGQEPWIVIGGAFSTVGTQPISKVAAWNGSQWIALGSNLNANVNALMVVNGDIIAGGDNGVMRWNGAQWIAVAGSPPGRVLSVCMHDGALFSTGGSVAQSVLRLSGDAWTSVGVAGGEIRALHSFQGELYAGGTFATIASVPASRCAAWNGATWHVVGAGLNGGFDVNSFTVHNSELVAFGNFAIVGSTARNIARWNGLQWSSFGTGANGIVKAGWSSGARLYITGTFSSIAGVTAQGVATWDGSAWSRLGTGVTGGLWPLAVAELDGDVFVGGQFNMAGGAPVLNLARFGSPCRCDADVDSDGILANGGSRDGAVTIDDLLFCLLAFEAGDLEIDFNHDLAVTIDDLLAFLTHFDEGC